MLAKPHPYLLLQDGRDPADCLFESAEFNSRPSQQRVVSTTFNATGKVGDFRLHADVATLCRWVEGTPVPQRNFNVVILAEQPVRWYADLDKELLAALDPAQLDLMLSDVRDIVEQAFASVYPAAGLSSEHWWYFSASNPKKASFHLHADPDAPHPTWANVKELAVFMKQHVKPLLEREWREGNSRAQRLSFMKNETLHWVIDFSVYTPSRSFKLPLCCKSGKTTMALYRAPAGVLDTGERKQLQVGMPQVWSDSPAVGTLLPALLNNSSTPRATAGAAAGGASKATAAASASSSAGFSQQAAIVLQWLQRPDKANVGATACWSSFRVDATARTAEGTLAKKSARCPFKQGVHNSNQLKVTIRSGQMHLSCWAPACAGRKIVDVEAATMLDELFRGRDDRSRSQESRPDARLAHPRSSPAEDSELDKELEIEREIGTSSSSSPWPARSSGSSSSSSSSPAEDLELDKELEIEREITVSSSSSSPCPARSSASESSSSSSDAVDSDHTHDDDDGSGSGRSTLPNPLLDDRELDKQLSIERDLKAQLTKECELANFGMPLRMDRGGDTVRTLNRRYLLPPTLKEAESQLPDLMLHARVAFRSGMDTAKSSAFILYIKWLLQRFPELRILLVSCRLTLTASLTQRLIEAGIPCTSYLKCTKAELRDAQVVIVQLDSLWKLENTRPYEVVMLDECESTAFHFHAETLRRRSDVWQRLRTIIEQATQLIMLDAKLGCRGQLLLEQLVPRGRSTPAFAQLLRPSNIRIWVNEHRPDNKVYYTHRTQASFHNSLHLLLGQDKKLALVSNNCKKAKDLAFEIRARYPLLHVLLLTSESSDTDKLADCNTRWAQYDVVVYSPTVGAGVDFNPTCPISKEAIKHFDVVMAWGEGNSNPAREFVQMMGRVRKPKDGEVHLFLSPSVRSADEGCTEESIREEINHCYDTANAGGKLNAAMRRLHVDPHGQVQAQFHEPLYADIYILNRLEKTRSVERFAELVLQDIRDNLNTTEGGRIVEVDPERLDKKTRRIVDKERRQASNQQTEEECMRIARDCFASTREQVEIKMRLQQQQGTERDKRLGKRQHILLSYCLQAVPMVATVAEIPESPGLEAGGSEEAADESMQQPPNPSPPGLPAHAVWTAFASLDSGLQQQQQQQQQPLDPSAHRLPVAADFASPRPPALFNRDDAPGLNEHRRETEIDPAAAPPLATKLAEFVREHGSSANIDQFKLFCKANGSLHTLKLLLRRKFNEMPEELLVQQAEWDHFESVRLLKGLLRSASFRAESACDEEIQTRPGNDKANLRQSDQYAAAAAATTSSLLHTENTRRLDEAPHVLGSALALHPQADALRFHPQSQIWEDGGDLCCLDSVNTEIVERSVSHSDARLWLDANATRIGCRFRCKLVAPYRAEDVIRALRAALCKTLGLPLRSVDKRQRVFADGRPPSTSTSWSLASPQRDSLLELAYAVWHCRPASFRASCPLFVDWDVRATLGRLMPAFRWNLLTSVDRPEHWAPRRSRHEEKEEEEEAHGGDQPKRRTRKRKEGR